MTLPFVAALLVTALVHPVAVWLRARGLGRALSTWVTFVLGFALLGALGYFVVIRIRGEYRDLATQVNQVVDAGRTVLQHRFGVSPGQIGHFKSQVVGLLRSHTGPLASGVLTGLGLLGSVATGLVLTLFIGFFLLYDGDGIWAWLVGLFRSPRTAACVPRDARRGRASPGTSAAPSSSAASTASSSPSR